jgi:hypothetical protein
MKKSYLFWIIGIIVLIFIICLIVLILRGNEDDWIKDSRGVYIKHGNPALTPNYVKEQQDLISCSRALYGNMKASGINFYSQCLGRCIDYSIDIVHVPRISEDDLVENQCSDYRKGLTKHFIELDENENIVRIVE